MSMRLCRGRSWIWNSNDPWGGATQGIPTNTGVVAEDRKRFTWVSLTRVAIVLSVCTSHGLLRRHQGLAQSGPNIFKILKPALTQQQWPKKAAPSHYQNYKPSTNIHHIIFRPRGSTKPQRSSPTKRSPHNILLPQKPPYFIHIQPLHHAYHQFLRRWARYTIRVEQVYTYVPRVEPSRHLQSTALFAYPLQQLLSKQQSPQAKP